MEVGSARDRARGSAAERDLEELAVLRVGGLRRAEVAALRLADYRPGDPPALTPLGKGNKERRVTLNGDAALALARWLGVRLAALEWLAAFTPQRDPAWQIMVAFGGGGAFPRRRLVRYLL